MKKENKDSVKKETEKNKGRKKKIRIISLCLVLLAAAIAVTVSVLTDKGTKVSVYTVKRADVKEYYETSALIQAGSSVDYPLYYGVKVLTVNVSVGDEVKKGDVIATLDTSAMDAVIADKKSAYDSALSAYNDAKNNGADVSSRIAQVNSEIASVQNEMKNADSTSTLSDSDWNALSAAAGQNLQGLTYDQLVSAFTQLENAQSAAALSSAVNALSPSATAYELRLALLSAERTLLTAENAASVLTGYYKSSCENAKQAYDDAVSQKAALSSGLICSSDGKITALNIKAGEVFSSDDVDGSSSQSSISDILSSLSSSSSSSKSSSSSDTTGSLLSTLVSGSSGSSSDYGTAVSEDSYSNYTAVFSLGKYDSQLVKKGMSAVLKFLDYKYNGYVNYISATASSSDSSLASLTGGSSNSNSLTAKAIITDPDDSLIVGFDGTLSILTKEAKNVVSIPVEALYIENGKKYVFVYEHKDGKDHGTAVRKRVSVGISSDKLYQVTSGLSAGDTVITDPSDVFDGAKVYPGESS